MLFITPQIARRLELGHAMRNYYYIEALHNLKPEDKPDILETGGGVVLYAGPGSPINRAIGFGLGEPFDEDTLSQVEGFFSRHNTAPSFDVCPLAERSWLRLLEQRGYRLEKFFNVLALSLAEEIPFISGPAGVTVLQTQTGQAELWIYTTAVGFGESDPPSTEELEVMAPNFHSQIGTSYLAWVDDQPAGGGGMFISEGVVELGGASTRPEFRRRGVQTALLYQRLHDARQLGCDLALVMTRPGSDSQRNIQRAGFELAYTKAVLARPG